MDKNPKLTPVDNVETQNHATPLEPGTENSLRTEMAEIMRLRAILGVLKEFRSVNEKLDVAMKQDIDVASFRKLERSSLPFAVPYAQKVNDITGLGQVAEDLPPLDDSFIIAIDNLDSSVFLTVVLVVTPSLPKDMVYITPTRGGLVIEHNNWLNFHRPFFQQMGDWVTRIIAQVGHVLFQDFSPGFDADDLKYSFIAKMYALHNAIKYDSSPKYKADGFTSFDTVIGHFQTTNQSLNLYQISSDALSYVNDKLQNGVFAEPAALENVVLSLLQAPAVYPYNLCTASVGRGMADMISKIGPQSRGLNDRSVQEHIINLTIKMGDQEVKPFADGIAWTAGTHTFWYLALTILKKLFGFKPGSTLSQMTSRFRLLSNAEVESYNTTVAEMRKGLDAKAEGYESTLTQGVAEAEAAVARDGDGDSQDS